MLYDIFIYPIEYVLKLIFETFYHYTDSYIMATIILSIVVSTVLLPFYYWADRLQAKERKITQRLKPTIDEFKSVYSGSKLHAVTSTLYRQNNYHPIYSLRSVMGLLVQVPFFIAAYHFLSTYQPIVGVETWLFKDLGAPDGWLYIGSLHINVMPFIMTYVNLVSGFTFTRDMSKSEEIQIWVLAVVFLVLLYASPALLVLYWTMNNVFSLFRTAFERRYEFDQIFNQKNSYLVQKYQLLKKYIKIVLDNYLFEILLTLFALYIYKNTILGYIPSGVNHQFLLEFETTLTYFAEIIWLLILITFVFRLRVDYSLYKFRGVVKSDFLLVLLPLTPIVQYIILNQYSLTLYVTIYILFVTIMVFVISILIIPLLLSKFISKTFFTSLILSLLTLLSYMPILSSHNSWHLHGDYAIQIILFLALFFIITYMYKNHEKVFKFIITLFFFINTLTLVTSDLIIDESDIDQNKVTETKKENQRSYIDKIAKLPFKKYPNIYLLTYDAYVVNETMMQYGIDNSKQEKFLTNNRFKIYRNTYSVASASISTMRRVLDMSYKFPKYPQVIAGNGAVYTILKKNKYRVGIVMENTYFYENKKPLLDFYFPMDYNYGNFIVLNSILEGEFRFDARKTFSRIPYEDFIKEKRQYMSSAIIPRFIYTHTGPHHSQNSGKCLPNEIELFESRLVKSNNEMKDDITTIINNDPKAIIIVNGDHGPYLTGNCHITSKNNFLSKDKISRLHIQDRFGTFLAIRWPKVLNVFDNNLTVLQDVFPVVFATLLNDKSVLKKLKVEPVTDGGSTSGAKVNNGIIMDGVNKGEPLFLESKSFF